MTDTGTCAEISPQLLENYRRCLAWRLELWFGPEPQVQREGTRFTVSWAEKLAQMEFHPALCRWTLATGEQRAEGSFDRVSKRLRQIFSGLT